MNLPQELVNLIIHSSKDDLQLLSSWCFVSRACLHEAKPLVYRKVSVMHSNKPQVVELAKFLFGSPTPPNPQLVSHIRELTIDSDYYSNLSNLTPPTFLNALRSTFASMSKLTQLHLVLSNTICEELPIESILTGHSFQLRGFYWRDFRWPFGTQLTLDTFLAHQPLLRTLEIVVEFLDSPSPTPLPIPSTACPELETFSGILRHFQLLAPTRPVINFVWSGFSKSPFPLTILSLDSIAPALSKLRVLVMHEGFPTKELDFPLLVSHLTSLEVLHLSFEASRGSHRDIFQIWRGGQNFVEPIYMLTNLRIFVLCTSLPREQPNEQCQFEWTNRWFSTLPKFERAYFNGPTTNPDILSCWARNNAVRPRMTKMEEVHEIYEREFGLETALLKPFNYISHLNEFQCDLPLVAS